MKSLIRIDKNNTKKYIKENTSGEYFRIAEKIFKLIHTGNNYIIPYYDDEVDDIIEALKYDKKCPKAYEDYFMGFGCWFIEF